VISRAQTFLRGHDNVISVITLSVTGKYIASGQKTFMGFQADIIIWDFHERALVHRLQLHKVLIQSLSFCSNELYLASIGGDAEKTMLIIWDVDKGKALYGNPCKQVQQIRFFNRDENKLLAVMQKGVQIISIDKENKKVQIRFSPADLFDSSAQST